MNPFPNWPEPDEEHQLLTQLNTGARTAREELAARYLPLLMRFLTGTFPWVAVELCDDAADRALLAFLRDPDRFSPTRLGLGAYLRMAARNDLRNLLDGERRARRGIALDSVAEPADSRNGSRDDELTWEDPRLVAAVASFDSSERTAFRLMLEGARDTAAFARCLGVEHLPDEERAVAVKRVKDRVKKRLVRAVGDSR